MPRSFGDVSYKLVYVVGGGWLHFLDKCTFILSRDVEPGIYDSPKVFVDRAVP